MTLRANWIWTSTDPRQYNQTINAIKSFNLPSTAHDAQICITADSWYRLYINGQWVNDGPCRSWPEHYQYDRVDMKGFLQSGENSIEVIAKYWGAGNFHTRPQQAGLLAQLDVAFTNGEAFALVTDETWLVMDDHRPRTIQNLLNPPE